MIFLLCLVTTEELHFRWNLGEREHLLKKGKHFFISLVLLLGLFSPANSFRDILPTYPLELGVQLEKKKKKQFLLPN